MIHKCYINITNYCSANCPFCCMSSSKNGKHMPLETFYDIVKQGGIIQLEGGEPLEHPLFLTMLDVCLVYADEVVIDTNGVNLRKHIDSIIKLSEYHKKRIHIKISYNNYVKHLQKNIFNLVSACDFLEYIDISFNVRGYDEEELRNLEKEIHRYDHTSFIFNSYGKLEGNESLPKIEDVIVDVYDEWRCYASDGKCFEKDLKRRANYEHIKISTY